MTQSGSRRRRSSLDSEEEDADQHRATERSVSVDIDDLSIVLTSDSEEEIVYEEPVFDQDMLNRLYEESKEEQRKHIGSVSEAGIIKSVSLIDFMCHDNLHVEFGPRLNFLIGNNGSGKSAVLTAIAVALGGKAAITGRGSSLKDLIKDNGDRAKIVLVLTNAGDMAYRPDLYPEQIVIERMIHANGSSRYNFRAEKNGKILGNKKSDLTAMLDFFNITVDSPLTVLTQDQARSFLRSVDDKTLYKFFLDGTQLSDLMNSYEAIQQNISHLKTYVTRQRATLPDLKRKVIKLQNQLKSCEEVDRKKQELERLKATLLWAHANEKEGARDEAKERLDGAERKVTLAEEKVKEVAEKLPIADDDVREAERLIRELEASRVPAQNAIKAARERLSDAKKVLRSCETNVKDIEQSIASEQGAVTRLTQKIADANHRAAPEQQAERERLFGKRTRYEEAIQNMRRDKPLWQRENDAKQREREAADEECDKLRGDLDDLDSKAMQIENTIRNLEGQSTDRIKAFGTNIGPLMQEIARTQWRHSTPIGPLGMHVKLTDMSYRDTVQAMIGSMLCGFMVGCAEDRVKLFNMMKRHQANHNYRPGNNLRGPARLPTVFTYGGDIFDFSRGDLSRLGETVLSKLIVDNPLVLRLLITMASIERTFVARTVSQGDDLLSNLIANGSITGGSVMCADGMSASRDRTSGRSGPMGRYHGNPLFVNDPQAEINSNKQELEYCDGQREHLRSEIDIVSARIDGIKAEMVGLNNKMDTLTRNLPQAESDLDKVHKRLLELTSTDTDADEGVREETLQKIREMQVQLDGYRADVEQKKQEIVDIDKDIAAQIEEDSAHSPRHAELNDVMRARVARRTQLISDRDHYEKKLRDVYKKNRDAVSREVEKLDGELEERVRTASAVHPEKIATREGSAALDRKKANIEAAIVEAEKHLGFNVGEIKQQCSTLKQRYWESKGSVDDLANIRHALEATLKERKNWWQRTRSFIAIRARTAFIGFSSKRGLQGRLHFDHDEEALSLMVQNTTRSIDRDGNVVLNTHYKTTLGLSGGERSYSTIALLLALWDTVPCPIRALDEWDVFLDPANRKVAAKGLMDGAREAIGKQYILITPQDMNGIDTSGPDRRVIRLKDPKRNQ
ncbi:hypothetical protein IAT38_006092 [Cryptococcus sp. DSM 104549]